MRSVVFWLVSLTFSSAHAGDKVFEFVSNKEDGLSQRFIEKIIDQFHPTVFFETGTYDGQTTVTAAQHFDKVITVEIYPPLFEQVQPKLSLYPNIDSYLGNSSELITKLGSKLIGTPLFWLDAHYSGEGTGMTSSANSGSAEAITAIREELQAIHDAGISDCVILIDDIRGFGTEVHGHVFLGCWAYPTIQEVKRALLKINPQFELALLGDMLLAYDGSKYHPHFSPAVTGCTKTRLYDGYNLDKEELKDLKKKIQSSSPAEKAFIKELYTRMSQYQDPMFWHDLWYGITCRKTKRTFQNASIRIRSIVSEEEAKALLQDLEGIFN